MIYVPDLSSNISCYTFVDSDTLRAYESGSSGSSITCYNDIFVNSHYLVQHNCTSSVVDFTAFECINPDLITNVASYRNDFVDILAGVALMFALILGLAWIVIKALLGRWKK